MFKTYSIILLLLSSFSVKADILRDSIGVENNNGKKTIIHKVVAHDTYYSIGRRYNMPPKEIMTYNENKALHIGTIIKVPTNVTFTGNSGANSSPSVSQTNSSSTENIIEHTVKPKDNLMRIAETYGTTVKDIKALNNLTTINLRIGQVLKISATKNTNQDNQESNSTQASTQKTEEKNVNVAEKAAKTTAVKAEIPKQENASTEAFIEHTVASNETIYSIATKYGLTINQLKEKNGLTTSSLSVGQKLIIKGERPTVVANTNEATDEPAENPNLKHPASRYGLNQLEEKGTALWIADKDLDASKMLVLHRSAPIGTVIKITNPMTNRTTYAKVVGKFTDNENTKDVIIVMTKAVSDSLGALDKRFFCNLSYGVKENE